MFKPVASLLLFAVLACAAPVDFNGRWDITVNEQSRKRAWWLEVTGAGTPKLSGSFIGAPGGGLDPLSDLRIDNDELSFSFTRGFRYGTSTAAPRKGTYRARVRDGKLEGTLAIEGEAEPIRFSGVRAPKFDRVDSSKLRAGKPIELFNGKDLSGWRPLHPDRKVEWQVVDGVTKNVPGAVDLVTEQKFWNFKLHAEYRVGPKSNSGIGLRARYEVQILEDHGRPASDKGNGALYSRIRPTTNASKPANEWQAFDITLIGNRVTVVLNGTTIIDDKEIEGLTAVAVDPHEGQPGPIIVQGDHGAVEFRKLRLTPLLGADGPSALWPQYRGPNGSGVAADADPVEFDPARRVAWKTDLPSGH
jgi:hypothetical protein